MVEEFPVQDRIDDSTTAASYPTDEVEEAWVSPEIVAAREGQKVQFGKNLEPAEDVQT